MPLVDRKNPGRKECAFCRIVEGTERDAEIIASADEWIAFFPQTPATPGHTLVIPRQHVSDFWALDERLAGVLAGAAVEIGHAVEAAVQPEGMNLISSKGRAAEQTVYHVHLHVLPRWESDLVDAIWPPKRETDSAVLNDVADAVRSALAAR